MKSPFEDWFILQFGPRETNRRNMEKLCDQDLIDAVTRGDFALRELEARRKWDDNRTAALYAWQARGVHSAGEKP